MGRRLRGNLTLNYWVGGMAWEQASFFAQKSQTASLRLLNIVRSTADRSKPPLEQAQLIIKIVSYVHKLAII